MSLIQLFRVLNRNLNILLLSSLGLAVAVFFFTRNLPKTYTSTTEIYTGISSGMDLESIEGKRTDIFSTNNEYSNLINTITSKQTAIEVGVRLLTDHLMLKGPEEYVIGEEAWEKLRDRVGIELWDSLRVEDSYDETLRRVREYRVKSFGTYKGEVIFEALGSPYSYEPISGVRVKRVGNSDLIEITYSWSDPGVSQATLQHLNEVFSERLLGMKVERSEDVVGYFRKKVNEARMDLEDAEKALADFRIENKIIDFGEQARSITTSKKEIQDEYQSELQAKAVAEAKLKKLESELALTSTRGTESETLLQKRKELADLKSTIIEYEVYYNDPEKLEELRGKANKLELDISRLAAQVYDNSRSGDGPSNENLLNEWLEATLALDASTARMKVLSANLNYYDNVYDEISPLGSQLSRLERAVEVAESKYIQLNTSLNAAILKQQSETIATSGITVTSPPTYSLQPAESKQLLLVMLSAVIGFIIPMSIVVLVEFLDNTVKTPIRGEELTGLKILGAYPDINYGSEHKDVDTDWLNAKSIGLISQNLRLEMRRLEKRGEGPRHILIFSTRELDGKSFITQLIAEELQRMGRRILILSPSTDFDIEGEHIDVHQFEVDLDYLKIAKPEDIMPEGKSQADYDYVFMELKGILSNQYPIELVEGFDLAINVVSAKRIWNKADQFALEEFSDTLGSKPQLIINGVSPDFMDQVLGDIKKKRSFLRKIFKGIITLQLHSKRFKK